MVNRVEASSYLSFSEAVAKRRESLVGAVLEAVNEYEAGNFPPGRGGGGCAIKKKMRSHRSGADGVVDIDDVFQNAFLEEVPFWTTPYAPLKEASRLLLDVASTPPVPGGNC